MREHVGTAAFGLDESESLGVVEPLDGTDRHVSLPHSCWSRLGCANRKFFAGVHKRVKTVRPRDDRPGPRNEHPSAPKQSRRPVAVSHLEARAAATTWQPGYRT